MRMILIILAIVTGLAYMSQQQSLKYKNSDGRKHWDPYLILLLIFLILFAGLRTSYNDTGNYARGFLAAENISLFLSNPENYNIMGNPLFYGFQSLIRTFTDNSTTFFIICAIIVNYLNLKFIKKYVDRKNFAFSIFLYVVTGTLMLTLAAQKQSLAMSVLTIAFSALIEKKYTKYYIVVFLAGCIHTYAWFFLFFPLILSKPWSYRTLLIVLGTVLVMNLFQDVITIFLKAADEVGKDIPIEEVFDGNRMNILRVTVYSVIPLTTLFFRGYILRNLDRRNMIFIQMTIISLMFMLMGMMDGANMFGRCANYFIMGMICTMPWIIRQLFTKKSVTIVMMCMVLAFTGFYIYDNNSFNYEYYYKTLPQYIREVL